MTGEGGTSVSSAQVDGVDTAQPLELQGLFRHIPQIGKSISSDGLYLEPSCSATPDMHEALRSILSGEKTLYLDSEIPLQESPSVEFKEMRRRDEPIQNVEKDLAYDISRTLSSFVNTAGGVLLYGVNDSTMRATGVFLSTHERDLVGQVLGRVMFSFLPKLPPNTIQYHLVPLATPPSSKMVIGRSAAETAELEGLRKSGRKPYMLVFVVVYVRVPSDNNPFVRASGAQCPWVRVGTTTQLHDAPSTTSDMGLAVRALSGDRVPLTAAVEECIKRVKEARYAAERLPIAQHRLEARILVAQQRRLAAVLLANRVAEQIGCQVGETVGYHIGQHKKRGPSTCITFMTCGMLQNYLSSALSPRAPLGEGSTSATSTADEPFDIVVVDEVHERGIETDLCLALLKLLLSVMPTLRVVLMSATPPKDSLARLYAPSNATQPAGFRGGDHAVQDSLPTVSISQQMHPVRMVYLDTDECAELYNHFPKRPCTFRGHHYAPYAIDSAPKNNTYPNAPLGNMQQPTQVTSAALRMLVSMLVKMQRRQVPLPCVTRRQMHRLLDKHFGCIVFLPGLAQIHGIQAMLEDTEGFILRGYQRRRNARYVPARLFDICILHSSVPPAEQTRALERPQDGAFKVVLATNIAESSITLPAVLYSIDTCVVNELRYNESTKIDELVTVYASQDACRQRSGRVGRMGPAVCVRLVPQVTFHSAMHQRPVPEIQRVSLTETILRTLNLRTGTDPLDLLQHVPDRPSLNSLRNAVIMLNNMGFIKALGDTYTRTPLGTLATHLPLSLSGSLMVYLGLCLGIPQEAVILAALASRGSPIKTPQTVAPTSLRALRRYALCTRSDSIAGYNAYVFWLRNRQHGAGTLGGQTSGASGVSPEAEFQWLDQPDQWLSQFKLRDLDDLVLDVLWSLSRYGLTPRPPKHEMARKMGDRLDIVRIVAQEQAGEEETPVGDDPHWIDDVSEEEAEEEEEESEEEELGSNIKMLTPEDLEVSEGPGEEEEDVPEEVEEINEAVRLQVQECLDNMPHLPRQTRERGAGDTAMHGQGSTLLDLPGLDPATVQTTQQYITMGEGPGTDSYNHALALEVLIAASNLETCMLVRSESVIPMLNDKKAVARRYQAQETTPESVSLDGRASSQFVDMLERCVPGCKAGTIKAKARSRGHYLYATKNDKPQAFPRYPLHEALLTVFALPAIYRPGEPFLKQDPSGRISYARPSKQAYLHPNSSAVYDLAYTRSVGGRPPFISRISLVQPVGHVDMSLLADGSAFKGDGCLMVAAVTRATSAMGRVRCEMLTLLPDDMSHAHLVLPFVFSRSVSRAERQQDRKTPRVSIEFQLASGPATSKFKCPIATLRGMRTVRRCIRIRSVLIDRLIEKGSTDTCYQQAWRMSEDFDKQSAALTGMQTPELRTRLLSLLQSDNGVTGDGGTRFADIFASMLGGFPGLSGLSAQRTPAPTMTIGMGDAEMPWESVSDDSDWEVSDGFDPLNME
ncbi:hypothetical protein KIPB_000317 [Kipferlia bialata]|uniref:ATP-dependent RNA helicase n=1 Tax=Kipferlia bialata TaxID=797122 RepID=A0A9K3CNL4_9EUKA|nr:hypothetical protein KIPB_000317 [Kipferlia bialata]|eukprot:g317.t1